MNKKPKTICSPTLLVMVFFVVSVIYFSNISKPAQAATYDWYFSQSSGNDSTGDGTQGNPWQTLVKVQDQENTLSSSDTATFNFRRGDTWTFEHDGSPDNFLNFNSCIVHINAYDTGADPIFSGSVSSWATDPLDDILYPNRQQYDSFIALGYFAGTTTPGSTISNIEIKNHHGAGIMIYNDAKNCTIRNVLVHNVGAAGITTSTECENYGNLIEYCTVYDAFNQQKYYAENDPPSFGAFAGGISMTGLKDGTTIPHDNTVRYCNVYNVYGEGIWNPNGITEYNVIGTTYASGIHTPAERWSAGISIVRHNLIYNIADASSPYFNSATPSSGIRFQDEIGDDAADNSAGELWVYGNIIINRGYGIRMVGGAAIPCDGQMGKVRIYNNTFIDCYLSNILINHTDDFANVKIYNNSSIFYSASIGDHVRDNSSTFHAGWDIKNNHFWDIAARAVDTDWDTDYKTGNPELPKTTGWRDLDNDKDTIDFLTMLYPAAGSALIGNGMTLDSEFDGMTDLFTQGTDFTGQLDASSFVLQNQTIPFSLGAVLRADGDATPPSTPSGLSVE
jgi:hypothetical protein